MSAVEGARRLVADGADAGALAPARAFDPASFLDHLREHSVDWGSRLVRRSSVRAR